MSVSTAALTGLRRYRKTVLLAATSAVGESWLFLIDYLLRFLRVTVLLALWRTVLPHQGAVSGMTLGAVLTYTLVAEVFAEPLACRTELASDLWQGAITTRLLQPLAIVGHYAADACGRWLVGLCLFSLPLLLAAPMLGVQALPASLAAGALFVVSLILAVSVGLALEFLFLALTVALEQPVWIVARMRRAITTVLSGALLPLALLPWGLGNVFGWLPFAAMAAAPLQIYTGTGEPLRLLLLQMGWSVVLWPAAGWLWRTNREKLVGYGG
jgi:ABC-2 type transport system permease protein